MTNKNLKKTLVLGATALALLLIPRRSSRYSDRDISDAYPVDNDVNNSSDKDDRDK